MQPRYRELARLVLWWKARLPGVEVWIAKRDVDSVFKLVWVHLDDVGLFATELPGQPLDLHGSVAILYLVLTFGWGGSPGNYMAFALAGMQLHEASRPLWEVWHDEVPVRGQTLMDDTILVEPNVGLRPVMSAGCAEEALTTVFGKEAINEKKEEEGDFACQQLVWGLLCDMERLTLRYPEVKVA